MHAWLAFLIGVLVAVAAFLFFAALSGTAFYGLTVNAELTLGVIIAVVALIVGWIFYTGMKAQSKTVKTGEEALIGAIGIATSDLKPKGEVRVLGEFWQAIAKDKTILAGQAVQVIELKGMFLVVQPTDQKA